MTRLIALHGPIGSGKTTLAQALTAKEFLWINYTDSLKEKAARALYPFRPTTVGEMNARKEFFRPFINAFGEMIDFAHRPEFIHESVEEWFRLGRPDAAFDNVRSISQALTVKALGFTIVKLQTDLATLQARRPASEESRNHPIDRPLPPHYIDICLDASLPVEELVRQVLAL
ncbi:hypothetical protein [Ktedonospora formicarum]|uniref:Uncharacterized protein n=1 Tax=Ktedonospora formicarum TaxID=2778364 RepID=A0A8J3I496_9CHLR|nr:hypothetical protein [Ktedonospora formicarum]GHO45154.1 hypothetical protein KSX_33170 [Ktedonospora formicarum]